MRGFSGFVFQLVCAAFVGYVAAHYAMTHTTAEAPLPAPSVQEPARRDDATALPNPPPVRAPSGPVTPQTAAAALSVSYRTAVEQAAPSVVTVHSARTIARGPLGLGGRRLLSQGLGSGVLIDSAGFVVT